MNKPRQHATTPPIATIHLTLDEKSSLETIARTRGYSTVNEYLLSLKDNADTPSGKCLSPVELSARYPSTNLRSFQTTEFGRIYCGDSRSYLFSLAEPQSINLIMTSPPFGLLRKKQYGNEDARTYCDWFRPFAEGFRRVLRDDGSLVIDIGGTWIPGQPTRSLYHFKLLIMLVEEYGFHLCQEHYWWNPAKLPTPAEWVNVRRVRVKDAVNTIWWLSKTPYPKASNRRILQPYSKSMKLLLKSGYTPKLRPSGHDISAKFKKNNHGSVPPNLLAIANTESNGVYQSYCRSRNLPIHPARFPARLPEYFIRFLTDPDDLVLDPFAGSCVTGVVSETLRRRWVCCELSEDYLAGARSRFQSTIHASPKDREAAYQVAPPCSLPVAEHEAPLFQDGGATRPNVAKHYS